MTTSGWGASVIRFISDSQSWLWAGSAYSYPVTGQVGQTIVERNDQTGWIAKTGTSPLANGNINDVAMKVLPNAPIDDATGLPIPTIATATVSGISVVRDDGRIFDITE